MTASTQTAPVPTEDLVKAALAKSAPVVADLMGPPVGVFPPETTVAAATEALREQVRTTFITYLYVTAPDGKLLGLIAMREMLLAKPSDTLESLMLREVFTLKRDTPLDDALRQVLDRHFPVYPVVDAAGKLVGLVRGPDLFANRAIEISAQAGSMVGVEKEERMSTPLKRSLLLRHPWLQINLLTAFIAAAVVGMFEGTLSRLVILAVFLPVMAGQTGNTGCQALAVALRGMTLGDINENNARSLLFKEGSLGFFNGLLVGITAGAGLWVYAWMQGEHNPFMFGLVAMVAMMIACTISGIAGAGIPLILKRFGADPATASSIFLTTASDIASMGIFLSLASLAL
ncbi:MAG: magnesium transporter [Novosphingobium sp.]